MSFLGRTVAASIGMALIAAPLGAQMNLSFSGMVPNSDGRIDYRLVAKVPTWVWKPSLYSIKYGDGEGGTWVLVTRQLVLRQDTSYWYSSRGLFDYTGMTRDQVLSKGVTQGELDALETNSEMPVDRTQYPITFGESSVMANTGKSNLYSSVVDEGDRRKGSFTLDVDFPPNPGGRWALLVTSAVGEERFALLDSVPGPRTIQVTDVEAGNCFATLIAVGPLGTVNTYHREVPVLVRKDDPGRAVIRFVTQDDSRRFRLDSVSIGQNSQSSKANLPLQQGKPAMVRVMVYDAYGKGGDPQGSSYIVELMAYGGGRTWTQRFNTHMSSRLVKSGRVGGLYVGSPGPAIPGEYIQPGMTLEVRLLDPSGRELDRLTLQPQVQRPRRIVIHGYDVRPPGGSGVPVARDVGQMNAWIMPYVQEAFPYSTVEYRYEGKIWLFPAFGQGAAYQALAMAHMNHIQGYHQTDPNADTEHLYLAMINQRHAGTSTTGMAWYGYRGMALPRIDGDPHPGPYDQALGYNMVHEMGHCFGLEHAPSRGANAYIAGLHVNRVDGNFQYGGAGLAGGWAYSALGNYFLAEDNHRFENGSRAHWDPMSYTYGFRNYSMTHFTDLYADRLMPRLGETYQALQAGSGTEQALATHPSGIPVFGPAAAAQAEAKWAAILGLPAPPLAPAPSGGGTWQGEYTLDRDPLLGDSDDPTPPILIVTQSPRIPGVTVPQ